MNAEKLRVEGVHLPLENHWNPGQRMECLIQLAGGLAHDLNSFLTEIRGHASLLLERDGLDPQTAEAVGSIYAAGERMGLLTRQLLAFGQTLPLHTHVFDLNTLIDELAPSIGHVLGRGIILEIQPASSSLPVEGDSQLLEEVLLSLVVTAGATMTPGGRLVIATRLETLNGTAPGFVCLLVCDNGRGMADEELAEIFEPFASRNPGDLRTGLGLAASQGIVKQHQGWIEVESKMGLGTTFKIFLPLAPRVAGPETGERAAFQPVHGTETILMVDDEISIRHLARAVLQRHGYRVLEAGSGAEALEVWGRHSGRIRLLFTDLALGGDMSGLELANLLLEQKPDLEVIYTSGLGEAAFGQETLFQKEVRFVPKPYRPQVLAQAVRAALHGDTQDFP